MMEVTQRAGLLALAALAVVPGLVITVNAAEPIKAGRKYHNLRYNEDFSYLGDPGKPHVEDLWDLIKWIKLSDEWFLTIGGQGVCQPKVIR
ncbi:MAG: hypothetical protein ACYSTG_00120 [Planctomycetota bacterium]|jgi:hypothetical protein